MLPQDPGIIVMCPNVVDGIERSLDYVLSQMREADRVEQLRLERSFEYFMAQLKREGVQKDVVHYQARLYEAKR